MKEWKGIVLAGGAGTRLHPITKGVTKQLLPVYDKPLIYYPLATLAQSGITEIAVITTGEVKDRDGFRDLLGGGSDFGLEISYFQQPEPKGIAQALTITKEFTQGCNVALILGDNIFHCDSMRELSGDMMDQVSSGNYDAAIFGIEVPDPERFGVVFLDDEGVPNGIFEKPNAERIELLSGFGGHGYYAVPGLYYYDADKAVKAVENLTPSDRGELEITDLHRAIISNRSMYVEVMPRGVAWFDAGTFDSLNAASNYVKAVQDAMGLKIGDPTAPW